MIKYLSARLIKGITGGAKRPEPETKSCAFIHIAKTAGTSLEELLHYLYGCDMSAICHAKVRSEFGDQTSIAGKLLYKGHLTFQEYAEFGIIPDLYISVVRDPIERARSEYCYLKHIVQSTREEEFSESAREVLLAVANSSSFYEFIQENQSFVRNRQCCALSEGQVPRFQAALKTITKRRILVGSFSRLLNFSLVLRDKLWNPRSIAIDLPSLNQAVGDQKSCLLSEPNYEKAIALLAELNQEDLTLFRHITKFWDNYAAKPRSAAWHFPFRFRGLYRSHALGYAASLLDLTSLIFG